MATRKIAGSHEEHRPSTTRRSLITGGAVGLAAVAGAALGEATPASAQTPLPSIVDWLNVTNSPYNAVGDGSADDWPAINQALAAAIPGQVVYLPVGGTNSKGKPITGTYLIRQPLVVPAGVCLRGPTPANDAAGAATPDNYSAIIRVAAAANWTNPQGLPNPAAIVFSGASGTIYRPSVENLWIDGENLGAAHPVDGIAGTGSVFHALIRNVGVWQASNNGIAAYPVTRTGMSDLRADGWEIDSCVMQSCLGYGVSFFGEDTLLRAVHAQGSGAGGIYIQHSNNRLIGCRADSSTGTTTGNGFIIDTVNSLGASVSLIGCGTEGNLLAGLSVISQVKQGVPNGMVIASGCSFDFDVAAGIAVAGQNLVTLLGCNVTVGTGSSGTGPANALSLANDSSGGSPILVQAMGGFWNCTSDTLVNVPAGVTPQILSYAVHGVTKGVIGSSGATAIKLYTNNPL